jgi:hypothetical protein
MISSCSRRACNREEFLEYLTIGLEFGILLGELRLLRSKVRAGTRHHGRPCTRRGLRFGHGQRAPWAVSIPDWHYQAMANSATRLRRVMCNSIHVLVTYAGVLCLPVSLEPDDGLCRRATFWYLECGCAHRRSEGLSSNVDLSTIHGERCLDRYQRHIMRFMTY